MTKLDFGDVIKATKQGKIMARAGWRKTGVCIILNKENQDHHLSISRIGEKVSNSIYIPTTEEMLAEDWEIVGLRMI